MISKKQPKSKYLLINAAQWEYVCEFPSFDWWVDKAPSWIGGLSDNYYLMCIDAGGFVCNIGKQFHEARDNDRFPIKVYTMPKG